MMGAMICMHSSPRLMHPCRYTQSLFPLLPAFCRLPPKPGQYKEPHKNHSCYIHYSQIIMSSSKSKSESSQSKPRQLTHFLSLASSTITSHPTLQSSLEHFTNIVTSPPSNIPVEAIRPIGTLHLTIGVMSLDDEGVNRTLSLLREWGKNTEYEKSGGLKVCLKGITTFKKSCERCGILFVEPRDCEGGGGNVDVDVDSEDEDGGVRINNDSEDDNDNNSSNISSSLQETTEPMTFTSSPKTSKLYAISTSLYEFFCSKDLIVTKRKKQNKKQKKNKKNNNKKKDKKKKNTGGSGDIVNDVDVDVDDDNRSTNNEGETEENKRDEEEEEEEETEKVVEEEEGEVEVEKDDEPLILHLTIVNEVYANRKGKTRGGWGKRRKKTGTKDKEKGYRVKELLEEFREFVWAEEVIFDRVELYKMGEVDGKYISIGGIDL